MASSSIRSGASRGTYTILRLRSASRPLPSGVQSGPWIPRKGTAPGEGEHAFPADPAQRRCRKLPLEDRCRKVRRSHELDRALVTRVERIGELRCIRRDAGCADPPIRIEWRHLGRKQLIEMENARTENGPAPVLARLLLESRIWWAAAVRAGTVSAFAHPTGNERERAKQRYAATHPSSLAHLRSAVTGSKRRQRALRAAAAAAAAAARRAFRRA